MFKQCAGCNLFLRVLGCSMCPRNFCIVCLKRHNKMHRDNIAVDKLALKETGLTKEI